MIFISCLLLSSAENHCEQIGPKSGPTECWAYIVEPDLDPTCLTLILFLNDTFEKVHFEINHWLTKKHANMHVVKVSVS